MDNRLAEFRVKHSLTQAELSVKANVSRPYISEIETGTQKTISNIIMSKIANALGESVGDIFFSPHVVQKQHNDGASSKEQRERIGGKRWKNN